MYPRTELIRLAGVKGGLRRRIARRRVACQAATERIQASFAWWGRALACGRTLLSGGLAPLGRLLGESRWARGNWLGPLLRWGPTVWGAFRAVGRGSR